VERLVEMFSAPDDLVCSPFLGSGTVGVAALLHHRRFIGADIDPAAVATARKRLS
jgi:DNA modification methylase